MPAREAPVVAPPRPAVALRSSVLKFAYRARQGLRRPHQLGSRMCTHRGAGASTWTLHSVRGWGDWLDTHAQTEHPMDPIKRPTRYQEMADPQARPRYTGIPTFFRAPHTESLADTDIGVIGVPYDGGVTNRTGARHGPRAVRDQSSLLRRLHPHGIAPFDIGARARSRRLLDRAALSRWKARSRRSPASTRRSSPPRSCRCRSAAIIRSACRSCARSRRSGRSA